MKFVVGNADHRRMQIGPVSHPIPAKFSGGPIDGCEFQDFEGCWVATAILDGYDWYEYVDAENLPIYHRHRIQSFRSAVTLRFEKRGKLRFCRRPGGLRYRFAFWILKKTWETVCIPESRFYGEFERKPQASICYVYTGRRGTYRRS